MDIRLNSKESTKRISNEVIVGVTFTIPTS